MSDQSFPMDTGLWDIAKDFWPRADASGIEEALAELAAARADRAEAFEYIMYGYRLGLEGLWADETQPPSDAYEPLSRRADLFRQLHEENEAAADREVEAMTQAVANIREAKDKMAAESHAAAAAINYNNSLVGTVLSNIPLVGVANEDVEAKYKDRMRGHSQEYAGNNENLPPAHDYMTTITGHGYIDGGGGDSDLYGPIGSQGGDDTHLAPITHQTQSDLQQVPMTHQASADTEQVPMTHQASADTEQQLAAQDQSGGMQPSESQAVADAATPNGAPSSSKPGGSGGAPAGGAPQAGGTSAMSGGAGLAERPSAAAPPKIDAGGGGGSQGPAGGFQGGAGSQSPARIVPGSGAAGVGGGGSDSPRTATSGSAAGEKPAAAGSGSGSQGAGVRAGGLAGVGAAGGATSAQGGAPAGYRTAMHADTSAGAGAHALRVEHNTGLLATTVVSGLTAPAFAALVSGTEAVSGSWRGLPSRLAARSPALSVAAAEVLVFGGPLRGSRWWGFGGAGGFDYAKLSLGVLERHGGISYLTLVFEERSVAPNLDAGVLCPVLTQVTSTERGGAMRPGFEVPDAMGLLDRSGAPAVTVFESDPGRLAAALARWNSELFEEGLTTLKLVAVGFVAEPDPQVVDELAQLEVESAWPGRHGYTTETAASDAEPEPGVEPEAGGEAAQVSGPKSLEELVREDPGGLCDPAGLALEEAGWYEARCRTLSRDGEEPRTRLTHREWAEELGFQQRQQQSGPGLSINLG